MNPLERTHPAVQRARAAFHPEIITEVAKAIQDHPVVVVGMAWNQPVKTARRLLQAEDIPYTYLEYGNYISGWRKRLALKIWAGWPTFPMVFIGGTLVGGASDLAALKESGELRPLLEAAGVTRR